MKILLLGDIDSVHLIRWATALAKRNIEVGLFSLNKAEFPWYENQPNISILFQSRKKYNDDFFINKILQLSKVALLKKIIRKWKPDIVHAHYATSYGLLGTLTGFKPFIVSVWGTDVFGYDEGQKWTMPVLRYVFSKTSLICSTSHCMKEQTRKFTNKPIEVIPFGSDPEKFRPIFPAFSNPRKITLASIKPVNETYGISYLIEALPTIIRLMNEKNVQVELWLVGHLSEKLSSFYHNLLDKYQIHSNVKFTGRIKPENLPEVFNECDIIINNSIVNESFGVTLVEAMMCERPLIVTPAPGPLEITRNGELAKVVPMRNPESLANAVMEIFNNKSFYIDLAKKSRLHAMEHYIWDKNVDAMINLYKSNVHSN
jgi:glycosyltransferase involved in cell wall biosynthesis